MNVVAELSGVKLARDIEDDAGMYHGGLSSLRDLISFGIVGWRAIETLLNPSACLGASGSLLLWSVGGSGVWYGGARASNRIDSGQFRGASLAAQLARCVSGHIIRANVSIRGLVFLGHIPEY